MPHDHLFDLRLDHFVSHIETLLDRLDNTAPLSAGILTSDGREQNQLDVSLLVLGSAAEVLTVVTCSALDDRDLLSGDDLGERL